MFIKEGISSFEAFLCMYLWSKVHVCMNMHIKPVEHTCTYIENLKITQIMTKQFKGKLYTCTLYRVHIRKM